MTMYVNFILNSTFTNVFFIHVQLLLCSQCQAQPAIRLCLPSNETYSSLSHSLVAPELTLQHSQLNP